jgi:RNA polymerase sigma-70 factor, ECF subfamily
VSNTGGESTSRDHQALVASDALSFEAFFARNEQPLAAYLRRLLASEDTAGDVAQEAFFRAWTHFETISAYDRPDAWLFRVATNLALSSLRRHEALSFTRFLHSGRDARAAHGVEELEILVSPEDVEAQAVERDLIEQVLRRLPERHRAALLLRAMHGFSVQEIAAALEMSAGNVYQMLSRGAKRFRELYMAAQSGQAPRSVGQRSPSP